MKCPHKNAEAIHAIADGKQTQWARNYKPNEWNDFDPIWDSSPISSSDEIIWRIKPPGVTQWRKDMAKALEDGKVVEFETPNGWDVSIRKARDFLDPSIRFDGKEYYRIRPKPDVVTYCAIPLEEGQSYFGFVMSEAQVDSDNLKLIWDGETGKLKDSEVLK